VFPNSKYGLPSSEKPWQSTEEKLDIIPACIGKWHLGHKEEYLPTTMVGLKFYVFWHPLLQRQDFVGRKWAEFKEARGI